MIIIPIIGFLVVEIILGYLLFFIFKGDPEVLGMKLFLSLRLIATILILVITNGLLTYYVSRSIIKPIEKLTFAANKISNGDLDYQLSSNKDDELGRLTNTFEEMRRKLKDAQKAQQQYEQNRQELIASI